MALAGHSGLARRWPQGIAEMNATAIKKYPIKLTMREREIIQTETFYDSDFAKFAIVDGKAIKVDLSLDEIEEIQGYVAAAANHSSTSKLQKELDRLFDKFQKYLDKHIDEDE